MNEPVESRSREVLYTCSYVPEEVILAAGYEPRRFLPGSGSGDAYVHPNICGYVKSLLSAALEGVELEAAGIIIANSCDAMRRLYDLWVQYVPAVPVFFLDVPKQSSADSITFFAAALRRLAETMRRELPGVVLSNEDLQDAIRTCNEVRLLMREVFQAQRGAKKAVRGAEVLDLCLAGTRHTKTAFAAKIRRFLADLSETDGGGKAPRILLTGGIISKPDLVMEIESAGGRVVVLDSCIGLRHYESLVEEGTPDAMLALAAAYLRKPACARMHGFEQRWQYLKETAENAGIDGVVFCSLKFCDVFLYDVPAMNERFKALGTPFLWIESDYTRAGSEQRRTRIETFLEVSL